METTSKKTARKSGNRSSETRMQTAYIEHLLTNGGRPPSVFKFCTDLGIKEDTFYESFGSFDGLERHIWKTFITKTTDRLKADKAYRSFSSREKILAFYYTLFEELRASRSFVLVQLSNRNKLEIIPGFLKDFKNEFEAFVSAVLEAGKSTGEVAKRPFLDKTYPQTFWMQLAFLLIFWRDDNTPGFEQTDAAIEKSVNLAFDLIGKGAIDSVIDFAKFLYQSKMK